MLIFAALIATSLLRGPSGLNLPKPVAVQGEVLEEPIHEVTFDDKDVREALKALFKGGQCKLLRCSERARKGHATPQEQVAQRCVKDPVKSNWGRVSGGKASLRD